MAGRGRGRGRGGVSLPPNFETLGLQRSEIINQPFMAPKPLYSHVSTMPVPDTSYSADDIKLVEIALRMKARWHKRVTVMTLEEKKEDIERYSDKFQQSQQKGLDFIPDWSQLPKELQPDDKKKRKRRKMMVAPNPKAARPSTSTDTKEILAKAKERLAKEQTEEGLKDEEEEEKVEDQDDEEEDEEGGEEEEEKEEEDLDEEEETDYNQTYFDNGEDYIEDDVDDDEPTYNFG